MRFDLETAIAVLERTPGALSSLLGGLPEPWLQGTEGSGTWSPFDVLGHLIHGERTDWIPRARIILDFGESRPFEPFDRFAQFRESQGKSPADLLEEFTSLRRGSLSTLRGWHLTDQELDRSGRHPALGPVTLRQLLATWTAHDLGHLAQVTRVMARQYGDEVGPWREYLPVLTRPPARFSAVTPQFTVSGVVRTAEYYRDVLGFQITGYFGDPPVFAMVARDAVEVFFNRADPGARAARRRAAVGYDAYFRVRQVDDLAEELRSRGAKIREGPVRRSYGQRELVVGDLNGLVLAFGEETS